MPSGESKNTFPAVAAFAWYVGWTAAAFTGAGVGSVTPWSPERSLSSTPLSGSFARRMRSGSHRSLMIGLTKSFASRSQSSSFQSFQAPFFHLSMSIPCSLSFFLRSSGILIFPSPAAPVSSAVATAVGRLSASLSPESQPVAKSASTEARATEVSTGEVVRRAPLPRRALKNGRMGRML